MADRVIFQGGDDLSEQNLALMLALGNQTNYFERGCGLDVDLNNDTVDIGTTTQWGNLAIVEDANEAYYLLPDKRTGLSLASNDVNYVYIWVDKDDDDTLGYYISTTDAAPTSSDVSADGPIASLKRGEIDTSQSTAADATTELNPNPAINAESVSTEEADVTAETYIQVDLASTKSSISSGTWTNVIDTENEDVNNEWDSTNHQFTPDETAEYIILGSVEISPGADGDLLQCRLRNTTDGATRQILDRFEVGGSGNNDMLQISWAGQLTAGKAYEIQARDLDSSFDIWSSGNKDTRATIQKSVVHP